MPSQSRGSHPPKASGSLYSQSTPNLPTLRSLAATRSVTTTAAAADDDDASHNDTLHPDRASTLSPDTSGDNATSASDPTSLDDFSLDATHDPRSLSSASSPQASGDEDGQVPNLPQRPLYHHHSRSYSHLGPSAFAPPFYGRPPTPLPPSPSLTSLLRPTFSSRHNSRPTTPDPSSDEGSHMRNPTGTQTPNSTAASTLTSTFRAAKPIPRASPKVPTYEYYGFTLYLTSSLAFIVYLLWAFLPSPFLHQLGIYYFPDRWWALAIPAWTVMLVVYIYVALASYNVGHLTLPLDNVECLVDEAASVAIVDEKGRIIRNEQASWRKDDDAAKRSLGKSGGKSKRTAGSRRSSPIRAQSEHQLDWKTLWNEGTDAVMDIPIGGVCEILYGAHHIDGHDNIGNGG